MGHLLIAVSCNDRKLHGQAGSFIDMEGLYRAGVSLVGY
jgi:hypothetical protein